uniref:Odorant-binding protein 13 n=1 Tax=Chrysopa pallens TaxID=417485 RepID=A0A0G3ZCM5_CHRPA|nr:odorant-binding protein 13 [Chrysopa pallens]
MLQITCLAIVLLVSVNQSYGFNNGDDFPVEIFTEFLSDLGHEHTGRRFKRHHPPPHDMDCCGEPANEEQMGVMKKCGDMIMKTGETKSREEMMKRGLKFAECMMTENGALTADGIVDKATFVEMISKSDTDSFRQKQMEESYDKCVAEAKVFKEIVAEKHPDFDGDALAAGFLHCQMRDIMSNCPADKFKADNKHCTMFKEMLEKKADNM